jgi:hypothetical protein
VELLRAHFAEGTPDEEWLSDVGKRGWVVLTRDQRIRRREVEVKALIAANVAAFVLTSGNLTGPATAQAFVHAYSRMQKMLRDYELPFVAAIDASGVVRLLTQAQRHAERKKEKG